MRGSGAFDGLVLDLLLGGGALAGLWYVISSLRQGRAVEDTPTSRVRSAAQGYVELEGRGLLPEGVQSLAPLTGLPCTWWSFRIEESEGSRRRWSVVESGKSQLPFLLDDGTGQCLIDPRGAQVFGASRTVWYGATRRPLAKLGQPDSLLGQMAGLMLRGDYRYTEHRLSVGGPLYAIGSFRSVGGASGPVNDEAVAALLRQWKQDQPALLGRFDRDGDGVLDAGEWEEARRQARAQVEREQHAREDAPTTAVLADPRDGRAFLLAQDDAAALARRFRWRFLGGAAGFVICLALLTWHLLHP